MNLAIGESSPMVAVSGRVRLCLSGRVWPLEKEDAMTQTTTDARPGQEQSQGYTIHRCHEVTRGYAEMLAEDVEEGRFCEMPHPTMNHPAFVYGHLAIYPKKVAGLLGEPDAVRDVPEGWEDLFKAGAACEADASKYPAKGELMERFMADYAAASKVVAVAADSVLSAEMPIEGMRERFPTVGVGVNFLMNNHMMMHLGQISAWRRAVGLGSVM